MLRRRKVTPMKSANKPAWEGEVYSNSAYDLKLIITTNGGFALTHFNGASIFTSRAKLNATDAEYTSTLMMYVQQNGGNVNDVASCIREWIRDRQPNGNL